MLKPWKIFKTW